MWNRFKRSFIDDINIISHDKTLLVYILVPIILCIVLKLFFPLLSHYIFSKTGLVLYGYYSLVSITLISAIPAVFGFISTFISLNNSELHSLNLGPETPADKKSFLNIRMIVPTLVSIITVFIAVLITDPVPSEGWLRSLFVTFLLSVQSPFVLLFIVSFSGSRAKVILLTKLYGIFLITVPVGLMLYHPWNYFLFFSPYYWISWAWVSYSPAESLLYGTISTVITIGCIIWFYSHLIKKNKT